MSTYSVTLTHCPGAGTRYFNTHPEALAWAQKSGFSYTIHPIRAIS